MKVRRVHPCESPIRSTTQRRRAFAIVSRYPLSDVRVRPLAYNQLRFRSRCRIALGATVITSSGRVRVVNVHLDTRINSRRRVAQLTPVLDALDDVDYPQIIGGDFNTMNIGWFRTMWPFPLKLAWLFLKQLDPIVWNVDAVRLTDHRGV